MSIKNQPDITAFDGDDLFAEVDADRSVGGTERESPGFEPRMAGWKETTEPLRPQPTLHWVSTKSWL